MPAKFEFGANFVLVLAAAAIVAALAGALGAVYLSPFLVDDSVRIRDYYLSENAVHTSPHSVRVNMDKGKTNYLLVDLRSQQEYEREHVIGAVNIPAYKDPATPAYEDVDRIVGAFAALPKGKEIIAYCYSMPCMTGRKIGKILAERGIYVKMLNIGWNEWRYYWTLWNHEGENASVEDYVVSGPQPGAPKPVGAVKSTCGQNGQTSC
ncbi:MAG: rhodanese-like domain-containing protein [Candidatus Micrarchaeia archaeon]|jgi:rhodanese-related sulfurtransferase